MICRKRDGSEYYEPFNTTLYDFKDAQRYLRQHFTNSTGYFYKDEETEVIYIKECLKEILRNNFDSLDEFKDKVLDIFNKHKYIEPGYYDCNDNLIISEEEINAEDFSQFKEDVWGYGIFAVININEEEE
jgi:hypothetical protein